MRRPHSIGRNDEIGLRNGQDGASNLFTSAADFYRKYRVPYPQAMCDRLADTLGLDGSGALLDVGCGTGEVFGAIGSRLQSVVGIDPNAQMLQHAKRRLRSLRLDGRLVQSTFEAFQSEHRFRLITFGSSFHWVFRESARARLGELLEPEGALAVIGSNSVWNGTEAWQKEAVRILESYLGERQAGTGSTYQAPKTRYEVFLGELFDEVRTVKSPQPHAWTLDSFVGYLYSTSFASPRVLGEKKEAFEAELRAALQPWLGRDGKLHEEIQFRYILAQRKL